MRKSILILLLSLFAFSAIAQKKMTIRVCSIQYGDIIDYNLDNIIMDGEAIPFVAKFQLTKDHFIQLLDDGKYAYDYASNKVALKTTKDFRITIRDEQLQDYDVEYSYKNQTLTFIYNDGAENLRLTRFTIDDIRVK